MERHRAPVEDTSQKPTPLAALVDDLGRLTAIEAEWDSLAVRARTPFGAPAWALAWWRSLAPRGATLAVVLVRSDEKLIGVAPFYTTRRLGLTEARLLSGGLASRLGIVAAPGREADVAAAVAGALAARGVDLVRWEGIDVATSWDERLGTAWPARRGPRLQRDVARSAPVIHLTQDDYGAWLGDKDAKWRREIRRRGRKLEGEGAVAREATLETLQRDLDSFARLHFGRWEERGGSSVPRQAMQMLAEVGEVLLAEGRFRLWMIDDADGQAISARVLIAAGGVVCAWNKGYDPAWSKFAPGILSAHTAIKDAFERGDDLFDLGGGETEDKQKMADEDRQIAWGSLFPRGARYPLARLQAIPEMVARRGGRRVRARLGEDRFYAFRKKVRHG